MPQCVYCKAETEMLFANVPVCIQCADATSEEKRARLVQNAADATMRADAASDAFEKVIADIPTEIPHPDGVQRIKNASRELSKARDEMMDAHRRLDDHIKRDGS